MSALSCLSRGAAAALQRAHRADGPEPAARVGIGLGTTSPPGAGGRAGAEGPARHALVGENFPN